MSTRKRRPTEVADPSLIPVLDLPENSASFAAMMEVHTNKSLAFLLSLDPAVLESVTEILIAIQDAREPDSDEEVDDEDACAAKEDVGTAAGGYGGGYGTDEDAEDDDPLEDDEVDEEDDSGRCGASEPYEELDPPPLRSSRPRHRVGGGLVSVRCAARLGVGRPATATRTVRCRVIAVCAVPGDCE